MDLPQWMAKELHAGRADFAITLTPLSRFRHNGKHTVLRRALNGLACFMEAFIRNDGIARQQGLLQAVDAGIKVLCVLSLIIIITLTQKVLTLAVACGTVLLLALCSKVPLPRLAAIWLALPLYASIIMLPAIFNVITPGPALLTLGHFSAEAQSSFNLPPELTITGPGVYFMVRFILRLIACTSLALLLTTTTRPDRLFSGLRTLGIPALFVTLLSMMERYLNLLVRTAEDIHLAKISRSLFSGTVRQEQAWVAAGMGTLFRRTQALAQKIHLAMVARGYAGECYFLNRPRLNLSDLGFIMLTTGWGIILWLLG